MKKFFFFLSAIALLGLTTACVEQLAVNNPNYDAEKGAVKTNFVINIANEAQTKATAEEVQDGTEFRGMEGIRLFMSKGGYQGAYLTDYVYDLGAMDGKMVKYASESNLTVAGAIDGDNSRRIYNMTMPIGVNEMVFYAKAKPKANSINQITYPFAVDNTAEKPTTGPTANADIKFSLKPINTTANLFTTNASAKALLKILNDVAGVSYEITDTQGTTTHYWKETDDVSLATAYTNFITTSEVFRQASADAVKRTMEDLYNIVVNRTDALSVALKAAILGANNANFTATEPTTAAPRAKLTYNNSNIQTNFPEDLHLPVGVAQVQCTVPTEGVPSFSWVTPSNTFVAGTDASTVNYLNIMYPAELCYWASSPIRISTFEGVPENEPFYPKTPATWDVDGNWSATNYGWLAWATDANNAITSQTRAVALRNNVLYGNALAEFDIAQMGTSYKDNRSKLVKTLADQDIAIDGTDKYFKVTGILIGGQPKTVDWNFVAVEGTPDRTGVIYDYSFDTKLSTTVDNDPLYVMVLDNYNPAQKDVVFFALELENHAGDFYGKDNIIYDGGKFYLAGKLNLSDATTQPSLAAMKTKGYRIPPVTGTGVAAATDDAATRIFIQDYVTTITVTLGNNALKNAYATIPDLRPIEMYFGLSVDLKWKAGAALSVEL